MWFECCNLCSAFIEQTLNNFGYVHRPPKITDTGRDKSVRGAENVYYVLIATQGKKIEAKLKSGLEAVSSWFLFLTLPLTNGNTSGR